MDPEMDPEIDLVPTEPTVSLCNSESSMETCLHFSLIPALLIVGVLSFLQRRKKEHAVDQRIPFLRRRFGIVIPMDTMSFCNRWSYGFAFGAISYSVLELFNEQHIPKVFPPWAKGFAYMIGSFEVGLVYFPFFACLTTPSKAVGAFMGILYSIGWIFIVGWDWFTCSSGQEWGSYQKLIYQWPWMISLIFLLGRFIYLLVKAVFLQSKAAEEDFEVVHIHQIKHVKRLLRPAQSKPLNWFERNVYEWDPYFKFPNRLIGTAIISLLALYKLILADLGLSVAILKKLEILVTMGTQDYPFNLTEPSPNDVTMEDYFYAFQKCVYVTLVSASLNMVVYIPHVLVCYRKQIKRLWKGQRDFLPKKLQTPSSVVSVASIGKYSGWQIAFILWGFVIIQIVQLLAACMIAFAILLIKADQDWILITKLGTLLVTMGLIFGIVKLQEVLAQYFFLQDKILDTDKEKPLALNNRSAFNCFSYFLFFYNVVMGVAGMLIRMLTSFMLGTWLVSRIDRSIMQKGYETLDKGYRTWIAMIFADHYHNNPVMVCFCQLLHSHSRKKKRDSALLSSALHDAPCDSVGKRVQKRWRLFYTLLKNPHLIPLRKHHLCAKVPVKVSATPQADIVVQAWLMRSEAATEKTAVQSEDHVMC